MIGRLDFERHVRARIVLLELHARRRVNDVGNLIRLMPAVMVIAGSSAHFRRHAAKRRSSISAERRGPIQEPSDMRQP